MIRALFCICKIVLRNFYYSIAAAPLSALYAAIKFRDRDTAYIVLSDHIGDSLLALGYLRAYRTEKQVKRVVIVCRKGWEKVLHFFPNEFDDVLIVSKRWLHMIMTLGLTNFGQHVLGKIHHVRIINPANDFTGEFFDYICRFPQVTLKDCVKYGIFNLTEDAAFVPPRRQYSSEYNRQIQKKRVIISPYASVTDLDIPFFACLSERLIKDGYEVYTNVAGGEEPLKGTKELRVDLEKLASIAEGCCAVIGLRSGILDLLMYSNCRLIAVYPAGSPFRKFFSLNMLDCTTAKCCEVELSGNKKRDILQITKRLDGM